MLMAIFLLAKSGNQKECSLGSNWEEFGRQKDINLCDIDRVLLDHATVPGVYPIMFLSSMS